MRLTAEQADIIRQAALQRFGGGTRIWLFGSRVDDSAHGADIDPLVEITAQPDNAFLDTIRTLLNRMEKLGLVTSTNLRLTMRNVRNRIVHDYLPEQVAEMFEEISGDQGDELLRLCEKLR
jgi:predicted nucleotidyltransferase